MQKHLIVTEDGSHTLFVPDLNEHYHSTHGAINESVHVYIHAGLKQQTNESINILEIGFGTGLNAYLTLCETIQNGQHIRYVSLEKYPLSEAEYSGLNYAARIFPAYQEHFLQIHRAPWNIPVDITPQFQLLKVQADLISYRFPESDKFDLIYFDAFAPDKQPEMWDKEVLEKIAKATRQEGIFVTYCAKGIVRRNLASLGFLMERLPGPPGKKEILRGRKI
jgi:tRNA U34 5-methylaminomethyl-2-thiouridine-forming methyltransferase MnmC